MFTGLVQAVGRVLSLEDRDAGVRLLVDAGGWAYEPDPGASICISGCCLTHAPAEGDPAGTLGFDVVAQTLRKTTLGRLETGAGVNLEASLRPCDPIGGHFVQGHVDGLGTVRQVTDEAGDRRLSIDVPRVPTFADYLVPTGSIAVDGVSLTLASVADDGGTFTVALIPTTLERTTLGNLGAGDPVNLEADVLAKAVATCLRRHGGGK